MISKSTFILFLLGASLVVKAQSSEDSLLSASIERVINKRTSDKPKLLFHKNGEVTIDSSRFRKVAYTLNKNEIRITLRNYTHKMVDPAEFWGTQTSFGQWQRFYKGEKYIVWHTRAPYIYRDYASSDRKINYFYSKNLTSEILPLTKESANEIPDSITRKQVNAYLKTHDIEILKDGMSVMGGTLPFNYVFSDGDDETPEALDFLIFHVKAHVYVIYACIKIAQALDEGNSKATNKCKPR